MLQNKLSEVTYFLLHSSLSAKQAINVQLLNPIYLITFSKIEFTVNFKESKNRKPGEI